MRTDICILLSSIIGLGGACVLQSVPKSLYTWADLYWNQCIFEFKFQAMQDIKMALILHPGLRDSGLDYPALSDPFFGVFFFLCVFVIAWLPTKSNGARTMSGSWEVCLYPGQHNLFLLKTEILREVPRVPSKFRIWREPEEGGTRRRGNHIHSVCHSPLKRFCCQEMHSNSIWNTNEIKGSSPPAGEHTDQWMPLCTEGATERRLRKHEKAVSGACGNRRDRDYEGKSLV